MRSRVYFDAIRASEGDFDIDWFNALFDDPDQADIALQRYEFKKQFIESNPGE